MSAGRIKGSSVDKGKGRTGREKEDKVIIGGMKVNGKKEKGNGSDKINKVKTIKGRVDKENRERKKIIEVEKRLEAVYGNRKEGAGNKEEQDKQRVKGNRGEKGKINGSKKNRIKVDEGKIGSRKVDSREVVSRAVDNRKVDSRKVTSSQVDSRKEVSANENRCDNERRKTDRTGEDKRKVVKRTNGERGTNSNDGKKKCPVFKKCGGCQYLDMPYEKQLEQKKRMLEELLNGLCPIKGMIGMEQPYYYRNKVHAVFDRDKKGNPISGVYKADTHVVVPVERCLIEDQKADEIIGTIRGMLKSFKIKTFDEETGYGFLRHVLVKRGFTTGEIMVVLVTASPIFPSKNNFVKALREKHPEITTIIQNVNNRFTSMVLGDKEHVLYGKGYIEDVLCGCVFRISSKSFYQINPVQTEKLYELAIKKAGLTKNETVIDAYCGIGTIGIIASKSAKLVIGVEQNTEAVKDAVSNAKRNQIANIQFYCNDAGKFMRNMAQQGEKADVVFMDPPRSGSTEEFMDSVAVMRPKKVVYISCGPETLVRDLRYFRKLGYVAVEGWGVDLFPWTGHVETVTLLVRKP